jgi:acetyl esterase/lipase
LHLADDQGWRLEIKSLPELTKIGAWRVPRTGEWGERDAPKAGEAATDGGFYTQEEIKELIRYASSRYIQILPEIDVPAHSLAAIAAYPNLSCTKLRYPVDPGCRFYGIEDNVLCPGQEATFEFLDKVFTEVAALFPFEYIHIGGDECYKAFWKNCPACQQRMKDNNLKDENELQSYFVKRLEKILQAKGKKLIGWDEILEGGLAPDATVMSWRGMDGGIEAAKAKHHVVMTPSTHAYLDLYQGDPAIEPPTYGMLRLRDVYNFEPVPDGVDARYILGGQGNLWTERVPVFRHAEYMLWPRAMALSEAVWSPAGKKDWNSFIRRMEEHFKRLDAADINYARSVYDPIIEPSRNAMGDLQIQLDTEIEGLELYYTFDNTYPDQHSTHYKKGQILSIPTDADHFKVVSYRGGKLVGRTVTVSLEELKKRIPDDKTATGTAEKGIISEMPLYKGEIPNSIPGPDEEERSFDPAVDSLVNKVSRPTLTAYLANDRGDEKNGRGGGDRGNSAVIICPGGGYHTLLITREGRNVAKAFNKAGVAAFVLKYRLPSDKTMKDKSIGPLQDAQQAIKIVRENALKWHIDPHKIGIMGFSAGAHVAATAGTHFEKAWVEDSNGTSLRPDFMILVYPVISFTDSIGHIGSRNYLLGKSPTRKQIQFFSDEFHVNDSTPPAFITQAGDDSVVAVANSLQFYDALLRKHIPAALQIYASGGHGYLKRPPFDEWFGGCLDWMKAN